MQCGSTLRSLSAIGICDSEVVIGRALAPLPVGLRVPRGCQVSQIRSSAVLRCAGHGAAPTGARSSSSSRILSVVFASAHFMDPVGSRVANHMTIRACMLVNVHVIGLALMRGILQSAGATNKFTHSHTT
jgi:hypothetical protein